MVRLHKPGYRLTRQAFWASFVLAWTVIIALTVSALFGNALAVSFAGIAVPSMIMLVAALLGIHRGFGSMDMRAIAAVTEPPPDEGAE